jgi:hypothetical protein
MRTKRILAVGVLVMSIAVLARAQAVTEPELAQLDAAAAEVTRLATTLKQSDPTLAAEVEKSLSLYKDEIVYLRVRLRKEGAVPRGEFTGLRDRFETLRIKAAGQKVTAHPVLEDDPMVGGGVVTVGTDIDVRLQTPLSSATSKVEQRFEATSFIDVSVGGQVVLPAGTIVRGFVGSVRPAGRLERRGSITLAFDEILLPRGPARLRASVLKALDGKMSDDVSRIGTGAVVGGILGGLLGGGKGLLVGVLVGGGGTMAATDGSDLELPAGTILRIRIDSPLEIR